MSDDIKEFDFMTCGEITFASDGMKGVNPLAVQEAYKGYEEEFEVEEFLEKISDVYKAVNNSENLQPEAKKLLIKMIQMDMIDFGTMEIYLRSRVSEFTKAELSTINKAMSNISQTNKEVKVKEKLLEQAKAGAIDVGYLDGLKEKGLIEDSDYVEIKTAIENKEKADEGVFERFMKRFETKESKKAEDKLETKSKSDEKLDAFVGAVDERFKATDTSISEIKDGINELTGVVKEIGEKVTNQRKSTTSQRREHRVEPSYKAGDARILDNADFVHPKTKGLVADMCAHLDIEPGDYLTESTKAVVTPGDVTDAKKAITKTGMNYAVPVHEVPNFWYRITEQNNLLAQFDSVEMQEETHNLYEYDVSGRVGSIHDEDTDGSAITATDGTDSILQTLQINKNSHAKITYTDRASVGTIENARFISNFINMLVVKLGNEVGEACIVGDVGAYTDLRGGVNGIRTLGRDGVNPGGYFDADTDALPDKRFPGYDSGADLDFRIEELLRAIGDPYDQIDYLRMKRKDHMFVVGYNTEVDIRNHFRTHGNDAERTLVLSGQFDKINGHSVVVDDNLTFDGGTPKGTVLFVTPKNFALGHYLGRNWRIETERKPPTKTNVYFTFYWDFKPYYNEGVIMYDNVQHG